jgi:uncharacterized membrane protein
MAKCQKCGADLTEEEKVCPKCGANLEENTTQNQKNNSEPEVDTFDEEDINKNKFFALLSYLSILVLIPIFAAPKSKYAHFHVVQGVNLLVLGIIHFILSAIANLFATTRYEYGIAYKTTPEFFSIILMLFSLVIFILSIIGIINAVSGKAKKLPLIGNFKIIK